VTRCEQPPAAMEMLQPRQDCSAPGVSIRRPHVIQQENDSCCHCSAADCY